MTSLQGKVAVVIGASSGVGRATAKALHSEEARVVAVARGGDALDALSAELLRPMTTLQADATEPRITQRLLHEFHPEIVVLTAGARPKMVALDEQTWETFSDPWNTDTRASFNLVKVALTMPLSPGSTVVMVSSGAAIDGSRLSGGYAGAKRMQWLLADYAQDFADKKQLGIRFLAILPVQLIEGTVIGNAAAAAYGAQQGISGGDFMKQRFKEPLDVDKVASAILGVLRGDIGQSVTAIAVTGSGIEPLE